jgi:hypothetical protein
VGAAARVTTRAGMPRASDQTAASRGPLVSRNRLPSRPGGGGGSGWPASAAAVAASAAEKVNTVVTRSRTW